jgi:hypothetical protein
VGKEVVSRVDAGFGRARSEIEEQAQDGGSPPSHAAFSSFKER